MILDLVALRPSASSGNGLSVPGSPPTPQTGADGASFQQGLNAAIESAASAEEADSVATTTLESQVEQDVAEIEQSSAAASSSSVIDDTPLQTKSSEASDQLAALADAETETAASSASESKSTPPTTLDQQAAELLNEIQRLLSGDSQKDQQKSDAPKSTLIVTASGQVVRVHFDEEKTEDAPGSSSNGAFAPLPQLPESAFILPGSPTWSVSADVSAPATNSVTLSHPEPALPSDNSWDALQFKPTTELPTSAPPSFALKADLVSQAIPTSDLQSASVQTEAALQSTATASNVPSSVPAEPTNTATQSISDSLQSYLKASAGFSALNATIESTSDSTAELATSAQQLTSDRNETVTDSTSTSALNSAHKVAAFEMPQVASFADLLKAKIAKQPTTQAASAIPTGEASTKSQPQAVESVLIQEESAPTNAVDPVTIVSTTVASVSSSTSSSDQNALVETSTALDPQSQDATSSDQNSNIARDKDASTPLPITKEPILTKPITTAAQSSLPVEPQTLKQPDATTGTSVETKQTNQAEAVKTVRPASTPSTIKPIVVPQTTNDAQEAADENSSSSTPTVPVADSTVSTMPVAKPNEQRSRFTSPVALQINAAAQASEPAAVMHAANQVPVVSKEADRPSSNSETNLHVVSSSTQDDDASKPPTPTLADRLVSDVLPLASSAAPVTPTQTTDNGDRSPSRSETTDKRRVDTASQVQLDRVDSTTISGTTSGPVPTTDAASFKPLFEQATPGKMTEPGVAVTQVVSAMQQAVDSSEKLRVHLNPPELGTVMVEVSRSPHGIVAKIEFSNASTQQAVQNSLPELHRALAHSGIVMDRVEVTIRDQQPETPERQPRDERGRQQQSFNQSRQEQSRQQQRRAGRPLPTEDEEAFERAA